MPVALAIDVFTLLFILLFMLLFTLVHATQKCVIVFTQNVFTLLSVNTANLSDSSSPKKSCILYRRYLQELACFVAQSVARQVNSPPAFKLECVVARCCTLQHTPLASPLNVVL